MLKIFLQMKTERFAPFGMKKLNELFPEDDQRPKKIKQGQNGVPWCCQSFNVLFKTPQDATDVLRIP